MTARDGGFCFGHPKGLYLLFVVEMWERFSFYGMLTLLSLFLTARVGEGGFGWAARDAFRLVGLYGAASMLSPIAGGWLADHRLGQRTAITIGAMLMALGHFGMAGPALVTWLLKQTTGTSIAPIFEASGAVLGSLWGHSEVVDIERAAGVGDAAVAVFAYRITSWCFYVSLALIVVGNGFFKSSISAMVGKLYPDGGERRDSGYLIFWLGNNLGPILSSLSVGALGERLGWHYGFTLAGFGMLGALTLYLMCADRLLGDLARYPSRDEAAIEHRGGLTKIELRRIVALLVLCAFAGVFVACFQQVYGLINVYNFERTDRLVGKFEVPATWLLAIEPACVLLIAPLVLRMWKRLDSEGRSPTSAQKVGYGLLITGAGLLFMVGATLQGGSDPSIKSSLLWPGAFAITISFADILIMPTAIAAGSKLAPKRHAALLMGVVFLFFALGNLAAGQLGYSSDAIGARDAFGVLACFAGVMGTLLLMFNRRWLAMTTGLETQPRLRGDMGVRRQLS